MVRILGNIWEDIDDRRTNEVQVCTAVAFFLFVEGSVSLVLRCLGLLLWSLDQRRPCFVFVDVRSDLFMLKIR